MTLAKNILPLSRHHTILKHHSIIASRSSAACLFHTSTKHSFKFGACKSLLSAQRAYTTTTSQAGSHQQTPPQGIANENATQTKIDSTTTTTQETTATTQDSDTTQNSATTQNDDTHTAPSQEQAQANLAELREKAIQHKKRQDQVFGNNDYFLIVDPDNAHLRKPDDVKKDEWEKTQRIVGRDPVKSTAASPFSIQQSTPEQQKPLTPEEVETLREHREQMTKILLELDKRSPKAKAHAPPLWKRLRMTYVCVAVVVLFAAYRFALDQMYMRMLYILETDDY